MNVQINLDELQNYPDTGAVLTHIREQIANGYTFGKFPEWKLVNNELLASCITLLKGIERGDIKVYPENDTNFDYLDHFTKTVENQKDTIKQSYKRLKDVVSGDFVECSYVHSASTKHLTRGKKYEVLNTDNYRFMIQCDSGVKKWYHLDNGHFKALK